MIQLTERQLQALKHPEVTPPQVLNPRTKQRFVLLPVDEYERLKDEESAETKAKERSKREPSLRNLKKQLQAGSATALAKAEANGIKLIGRPRL